MRWLWRIAALLGGLAACAAPQPAARLAGDGPPPAMRVPTGQVVLPPARSNSELAQDYVDLVFRLESGRAIDRLTRYQGAVTVSLTGPVPPAARRDLAVLLARLRAEAGIDISEVPAGGRITLAFLPHSAIRALVPNAACFVVPNVSSWAEYRRARRSERVDWAHLTSRDRAAVFIPSDIAPQEVRDCLHEEIAQALGPLNDLYRLSDSVFNDDNFHGTLTGFDMLMLRVHYAPDLSVGLSAGAAAALVPGVLERLNPRGGPAAMPVPGGGDGTPRRYVDDIETALGGGSLAGRRAAAADAVALAQAMGWQDARLAFALYSLGRLTLSQDARSAIGALSAAGALYAADGARIQLAHVDLYMAGVALQAGTPQDVIGLADRAAPVAEAYGNAALLSSLLAMKAIALDAAGGAAEAARARLDSRSWAGYGFGPLAGARLADIAALAPVAQANVAQARSKLAKAGTE